MPERRLPPGPPPATSLLAQLRLAARFNRNSLGTLAEWAATYGDIYLLQIGKLRQYIVRHPDYIHEVVLGQASKFHKDEDYKSPSKGLARFLGNGLLTSDGEFWKRQRKLAAPAFHTGRITGYAGTMVEYTLRMLERWQDGARLDISKEMTRLTMEIVAKTLFDADVSADAERIGQAVADLQHVLHQRSLLPNWVPTRSELNARRALRNLDELVYPMIRQRRAEGTDKGDLLSMLLLARDEDGSAMTDRQARDETVTIFLAGHETTANALNWTWYLLAQHPEVEARLHEELETVLAGRAPTLEDLARLPYTEKVIKESMRIYPPAWGFSREAIEDVEIGGYAIPKGSIVGVMSYFTHRDPRWFPEPERFDPDRFTPEFEANLPRYAYIPFGGGPRICIGNAFAMMEARLLLATIASRYSLALAPGQQVELLPQITLNPKGGLPMTLHVRERVPEPALA